MERKITYSKTKKSLTPWGLYQEVDVFIDGLAHGHLYKEPEMTEWAPCAGIEEAIGREIAGGDLRTLKKDVINYMNQGQ